MAEAKASVLNIGIPARKTRLVADLIRGKKVSEARAILQFTRKASAPIIKKVLESAVATMEKIGARRDRIVAALGPCIGPDAYEVGPEFEANFIAQSSENQRFFRRPSVDARPYFDLPAFVLARLGAMRLGKVESRSRCTYSHSDDFFSYRRTTHRREPDYGRQISAIVLL